MKEALGKRKRRPFLFAAAAASAILIVLAVSSVSCGGPSWTNTLTAYAFPSGEKLTLHIRMKAYHEHGAETVFLSRSAPVKLLDRIADSAAIDDSKKIGVTLVIRQEREDGRRDYYSVRSLQRRGENGQIVYSLDGMTAQLRHAQDSGTPLELLFPVHLVSDPRIVQNASFELVAGAEYECARWASETDDIMQAFEAFYRESGWYETDRSEDGLTIRLLGTGTAAYDDMYPAMRFETVRHVDRDYFTVTPLK